MALKEMKSKVRFFKPPVHSRPISVTFCTRSTNVLKSSLITNQLNYYVIMTSYITHDCSKILNEFFYVILGREFKFYAL